MDPLLMAARDWGWVLVRGIIAIIFGLIAIFTPSETAVALLIVFGWFAIADGIVNIIRAIMLREYRHTWWLGIVGGLLGIGIGIVTFTFPAATALTVLYLVASWAVVTGALQIIAAIALRREIEGEWLLGIGGAISLLFGLMLFITDHATATIALVYLIGFFAIFTGTSLVVSAFRLRQLKDMQRFV
jgi:uncharacterized membrane protein HdeD (DUF308 family)